MSISEVSMEEMKTVSEAISLVNGQAEDLKRFAEANGVNIIIAVADQKEYKKDNVAMCQMGHVHESSDLNALHALHQNMERAKDILEAKIMNKMIKLKEEGKLDIKLTPEETRKLEEIKKFFDTLTEDEKEKIQ